MTETTYNYAFILIISYTEPIKVTHRIGLYVRNKDGVLFTKRGHCVARKYIFGRFMS